MVTNVAPLPQPKPSTSEPNTNTRSCGRPSWPLASSTRAKKAIANGNWDLTKATPKADIAAHKAKERTSLPDRPPPQRAKAYPITKAATTENKMFGRSNGLKWPIWSATKPFKSMHGRFGFKTSHYNGSKSASFGYDGRIVVPTFQPMKRIALLTLAPFGFLATVRAQNMTFAGGTLQVASGTTVELVGPITWQLASDAVVVNDGTIDLGTEGTLVETIGSPITGAGIETATWALQAPLSGAEPGGLGLSLTTNYADGNLKVERGHEPRNGPNGTTSIRRWFRTLTPQPNTEDLSVVFRYAPTELDGIVPTELALFVAEASNGPWSAIATIGNEPANELSGTDQSPIAYITAFDLEATLKVPASASAGDLVVYPTVFENELRISIPEGSSLERFELMDAQGKVVLSRTFPYAQGIATVQVPTLAAGAYLLRLNGNEAVRLMHP